MCNELDIWTKIHEKMQTWGKQEDKKEIYHSTLVLERLFMYMFQEDSKVTTKKITKTQKKSKSSKEDLQ
jgi:hypothetical protein